VRASRIWYRPGPIRTCRREVRDIIDRACKLVVAAIGDRRRRCERGFQRAGWVGSLAAAEPVPTVQGALNASSNATRSADAEHRRLHFIFKRRREFWCRQLRVSWEAAEVSRRKQVRLYRLTRLLWNHPPAESLHILLVPFHPVAVGLIPSSGFHDGGSISICMSWPMMCSEGAATSIRRRAPASR